MSLKGFNLLQNNEPPDAWDKVYDWITNVGRVIVIVVELVVVGSFFVRIVVDTQTKNLAEQEKQLSQTLSSLQGNESKFREQQEKFKVYKDLWNGAKDYATVITEINSILPQSIRDLSINVAPQNISIKGVATGSDLKSLEEKLRASKSFSRVTIPQLEGNSGVDLNSTYNINIELIVKPEILEGRAKISAEAANPTSPTNK